MEFSQTAATKWDEPILDLVRGRFPHHSFTNLFRTRRSEHVIYGVLCGKDKEHPDMFLKAALTDPSRSALLRETRAYEVLGGQAYVPRYFGSIEDSKYSAILIERLTDVIWPPPWNEANVEQVVSTLREISHNGDTRLNTPISAFKSKLEGWRTLESEDRFHFTESRLNLPKGALQRNAQTLISLSEEALEPSNDLLHFDVRSDNLCFRGNGMPLLLDWSWWCRGQFENQLAAWGASLSHELGAEPWELGLEVRPAHVALVAGYFSQFFGIPYASGSHVRPLQALQAEISVKWLRHLGVI